MNTVVSPTTARRASRPSEPTSSFVAPASVAPGRNMSTQQHSRLSSSPTSSRQPQSQSQSQTFNQNHVPSQVQAYAQGLKGAEREHCSYCLIAEFDIKDGSTLSHQYPEPTGADEHLLAELMVPDGAHDRAEDWTIFFLNLSSKRHSGSGAGHSSAEDEQDYLYVLNLVRTKHDDTVRRGAMVKALAICTRHPFIQVFKPILLLALDDYFVNPSPDCLARLYESINSVDLSLLPSFTRDEKLILRATERRDMFEERFLFVYADNQAQQGGVIEWDANGSGHAADGQSISRSRASSDASERQGGPSSITSRPSLLGTSSVAKTSRRGTDESLRAATPTSSFGRSLSSQGHLNAFGGSSAVNRPKDTHFFDTRITYGSHTIPIRLPLTTFPEEVGDYSVIKLIQAFSVPASFASTSHPPFHPHLHSNGPLTHPVILIFNALVTGKRVVFLGYGQPAGLVANFVLAACALASGSGVVLRGFIERAFPYTNLTNVETLETVPGYIAGVTNPTFEDHPAWWDVLCNIESGKITVSKDIAPAPVPQVPPRPSMTRDGTIPAATMGTNTGGIGNIVGTSGVGDKPKGPDGSGMPGGPPVRPDSTDNVFMEDITASIQAHFGESAIRSRLTDYVARFVRVAARYEEEVYGSTSIGLPSQPFLNGQLGSGTVFVDDQTKQRELTSNATRIEGWRVTKSYRYHCQDFRRSLERRTIRNFDVGHQLSRLKYARKLSHAEAGMILTTMGRSVKSSEQVIELLALLPQHSGGLIPLGIGLFHPDPVIRDGVLDLFITLAQHAVGKKFVQSLNAFHRMAFNRLSSERLAALKEKEAREKEWEEELGRREEQVGRKGGGFHSTSLGGASSAGVGGLPSSSMVPHLTSQPQDL